MSANVAIPQAQAAETVPPPLRIPPLLPAPPAFGVGLAVAIVGIAFAAQFWSGAILGGSVGFVEGFRAAVEHRAFDAASFQKRVLAPSLLVPAVFGSGAGIAITLLLFRNRLRDGTRTGFAVRPAPGRSIVLGALYGLCLAVAYHAATPLLVRIASPAPETPMSRMLTQPGFGRVAFLVVALLVAPPAEEFLFRGVLLAGLSIRLRPAGAAALVTAVFLAAHLPQTLAWWPAALAITGLGVVTAMLRIRSGSLLPGVAAHAAYNAVVCVPVVFGGFS